MPYVYHRVRNYRFLLTGIGLALMFLLFEAGMHAYVFHLGRFTSNLFPRDANELWMRFIIQFGFIAFGGYADSTVMRMRKTEAEREALQRKLEETLTKVIDGFVPICAICKDIRNKDGSSTRIEAYIQQHTEARFTHGICPNCAKAVYDEYIGQLVRTEDSV